MGMEVLEDKDELLRRLYKKTIVGEGGCFLWQGALNNVSYGHGIMKLWKHGPKFYAHRLAAYIFHDYDLNSELQVNHTCSNQNCWNPNHLYVGTQSQNMRDKTGGELRNPEKWASKHGIKVRKAGK